jgi:transcriptional regulator with PAS, ATPase and Fis domain
MERVAYEGTEDVLNLELEESGGAMAGRSGDHGHLDLKESLSAAIERIEKTHLKRALSIHSGNRRKAAEYLGISYRSMMLKMKKYGLRDRF